MWTFEDFKKAAVNSNLKSYEKVGFQDCHRQNTEENIFKDISEKLSLELKGNNKNIMDIGCGCSKPVFDLIDYARENQYTLYLVDSKEMLDCLPNDNFINKIYCEFPKCENLEKLKNKIDYLIVYSVLHHVIFHANYIKFLDFAVELLSEEGKVLIADLPNIMKKKRFLSSRKGIEFHKKWSGDTLVPNVKLDNCCIDDSLIFSILQRYRNMGYETYLLEQKDGLPMNKTREDILIKRY